MCLTVITINFADTVLVPDQIVTSRDYDRT